MYHVFAPVPPGAVEEFAGGHREAVLGPVPDGVRQITPRKIAQQQLVLAVEMCLGRESELMLAPISQTEPELNPSGM